MEQFVISLSFVYKAPIPITFYEFHEREQLVESGGCGKMIFQPTPWIGHHSKNIFHLYAADPQIKANRLDASTKNIVLIVLAWNNYYTLTKLLLSSDNDLNYNP